MPKVNFIRQEVAECLPKWNKVDHCLGGEDVVKAKKATYLPKPDAEQDENYSNKRFKAYLERAVFYNVTGRTHEGLLGQVFSQEPVQELPPILKLYESNLDGAGTPLIQQAKRTLGLVLAHGRCGLLADFPSLEEGRVATLADVQSGLIRPRVFPIRAKDIINWRVTVIGGETLLTLLVIAEKAVVGDDGFELKSEDRWREIRMEPINAESTQFKVVVTIWRKKDKTTGSEDEFEIAQGPFEIQNYRGQAFNRIPFQFVGAVNNDPDVDKSPLLDLANLNLAHYRNSADYEESCFMVGQPTPYFTGLTKEWVEEIWKGKVILGSRASIPLPTGATAGLLQASENQMPFAAMKHKEEQMKSIGAKLIEPGAVQQTATETQIDEFSETSVLSSAAKNVSVAYEAILAVAGQFIGEVDPESIEFQLNTEFSSTQMTPQDRQQLVAEWQGGLITWEEARAKLKKGGIATEEADEARAKVDMGSPEITGPGE